MFVRLCRIMHRRDYGDLPTELATLLSGFAGVRLNGHDQCLNVLQTVFAALGGLDVRAEPKEKPEVGRIWCCATLNMPVQSS